MKVVLMLGHKLTIAKMDKDLQRDVLTSYEIQVNIIAVLM